MTVNITDEELHNYARLLVGEYLEQNLVLDKKQLRFNDIIRAAKIFYPLNPIIGVRELVESTNKGDDTLYIKGQPMWQTLEREYTWMIPVATSAIGSP